MPKSSWIKQCKKCLCSHLFYHYFHIYEARRNYDKVIKHSLVIIKNISVWNIIINNWINWENHMSHLHPLGTISINICTSICLSIYLSIYLSVLLITNFSIHLSIPLFNCMFIHLLINLSINSLVYLYISSFIYIYRSFFI